MIESAIEILRDFPWYWILVISFFLTFIENLFPPSPSDVLLLFMGTLVGVGIVGFFPLLISATIGSTLGFAAAYWLGYKFEVRVIESNKLKFISREGVEKVERWFAKYGFWLIVINRFLSGTRAIIAIFAGMSKLDFRKSVILSSVSALLWNFLVIFFGMKLGNNWKTFDSFMDTYGRLTLFLVIASTLSVIVYIKFIKKSNNTAN